MCDLNPQDIYGDTPMHYGLHGEMGLDVLEFFLSSGANIHIRNYKGRSVLHEAVKYSHLGIPAVDLLLKYGASLNAIDDQGATVLHDALKNPRVTLTIIKTLLEYGALPDYRDNEHCPPLAYCESSSLLPAEKESAAKLLIQFTVMNKLGNDKRQHLESESVLVEGDEILCLNFCEDTTKRNEWATFREYCIAEIMSMAKLSIGNAYLLELVTNHYYKQTNEHIDISSVDEIFSRLASNKYPIYRDIIISAIEECDFDVLLTELEIRTMKFTATEKTGLISLFQNSILIRKISTFLSKVDLINLNIACLCHLEIRKNHSL